MLDQFGLEVGPGFVGGGGDTIQSISLANGGDGSGFWTDPGVWNQYASTVADTNAIRQLASTQPGNPIVVTGTGSLSNGGDMTAYLPQLMQNAGISPTQGILNAYQGVTGQQYSPGSQTAYNPQTGGYDISGVTNALDTGFGGVNAQLSGIGNQFSSGLSGLANTFQGQIGSLGNQFSSGLSGIGSQLGALGNQFGSLGSQFGSGLSQLGSTLGSQFDAGFNKFGEQLGSQFGSLNNSLTSLAQQMTKPDAELQALNQNFGSFLDMYKKQFERTPYQPKAYEKSPYVDQMVQSVTDQMNNNWQRNTQPTIASQAQSVGGYGGSRQGVVEANALNDMNRNLASTTANIYQTDYENQQNRNLQEYAMNNNLALGMGGLALQGANARNQNQLGLGQLGLGVQNSNQNYNLGLGNLGLGFQNSNNAYNLGLGNLGLGAQTAMNNFYTSQRGQDLQGAALGAQLMQQGNNGFLNQGQGIYNIGNTYQQAPWSTIGNFGNAMNPWAGATGSATGTQGGNPWASAIGGAIGGAQLGNIFSQKGATWT